VLAAAPAVSEPTADVSMDLRVKPNRTGPHWFLKVYVGRVEVDVNMEAEAR